MADCGDRFGNDGPGEHEASAESIVADGSDGCRDNRVHAARYQFVGSGLDNGVATVAGVIDGIAACHAHAVDCGASLKCKTTDRLYSRRNLHLPERRTFKEC